MEIKPYTFRCYHCGKKKEYEICLECNRKERKYTDSYHKCDKCRSYYEGHMYHCVVCGHSTEPMADTFLCECGKITNF